MTRNTDANILLVILVKIQYHCSIKKIKKLLKPAFVFWYTFKNIFWFCIIFRNNVLKATFSYDVPGLSPNPNQSKKEK